MPAHAPLLVTPAWSLALGTALAFYPLFVPLPILLLAASALAGGALAHFGGLAMLRPGAKDNLLRAGTWPLLLLAFASGLVLGLALRLDEAGAARPFGGRLAVPAVRPGVAALTPRGLEGSLVSDAAPPRSGSRFYTIEVEELVLAAPGLEARVSAKGRARVMVREGPALVTGARVVAASGRLLEAKAGEEPLFVAEASSFRTFPPRTRLDRLREVWRSALIAALDLAGGGEASSGLLVALLSGSREGLDREEAEDFKRAGCAAVLSLSGQHLSILAAAIALVLKPLGGPRKARGLSLLLACLFVFVAGPEPALLRSLVMYALATLAALSGRPQGGRTVLGLSFVAQVIFDPASARGLSFVLSYLALAGLVVLAPRFERLFLPVMPPFLASAFAVSFAAQAATAPLCVFVFGALYPAGLLASVLSAPLVAAFLWWGLAAALACGLAPAASLLVGPVTRLLHEALAALMAGFAAWPSLDLEGRAVPVTAASVVLIAAFVYALPHAEHARGLRFPPRPQGPARSRGAGHVQALRPELPREAERARAHPRNRPRHREAARVP